MDACQFGAPGHYDKHGLRVDGREGPDGSAPAKDRPPGSISRVPGVHGDEAGSKDRLKWARGRTPMVAQPTKRRHPPRVFSGI